tara:strand:- start:2200 stop:2700 length:501 start_codon:yes stop_codon:yes gene_type:complete
MGMGFDISKRGELYMISQGTGGGYGDPLERDPTYVIMDIEEGLITSDWAKKLYKVEFNEETFALDLEATEKLRADYRELRKQQGKPYAEFVKAHVKDTPPENIPFYGSWNSDLDTVYAGSIDDKRDAKNPGPIYVTHPKDVRIEELEAELEAVRKQAGIPSQDTRK